MSQQDAIEHSSSQNNSEMTISIISLPTELILDIYSYCNLDDLRNLLISSSLVYEFLKSSEAYRVWMIQLKYLQNLRRNLSKTKRKQFKNNSFMELSDDFEKVGKNNCIENRTTILMKVIRKQQHYYILKDLERNRSGMLEKFHARPRYFEDFKHLLLENYYLCRDPLSNRYLMEYDPFYLFKHFPHATNYFFLPICRFIFLKYTSNSLRIASPFLQAWKKMSNDKLEPNVKIWKEYFKRCFRKDIQAIVLAYFQMPYQLHDGKYKTAAELVAIDKTKWLSHFTEEFECDSQFKFLNDHGWISTIESW
ncbi:hypothetical protein NAEGRDRAFT_64907 [Naegleria gruberi]|uniref:F-box domain-containing protein n=1 Tax=Naegleria gruberi TaxID=5762 RepID=D2V7S4_NAEGR|nr:uncharacterized protein NAEGRDRAFT_64907 [Naegleria gruberi]EFC47051.1 hypothetical protein NAEGRDRAFT_64907 [Naegleria gruberi]|eukprot:XP_002679795.1 hypothetical protein NAEGRDRAFT_64907 [Naegleria gruberi strain NEG-M]